MARFLHGLPPDAAYRDTRFQRHDCPRLLVQDAEPQRPEMKVPTTIIDAVQTDHFSGERLADEHVTPARFMAPSGRTARASKPFLLPHPCSRLHQ